MAKPKWAPALLALSSHKQCFAQRTFFGLAQLPVLAAAVRAAVCRLPAMFLRSLCCKEALYRQAL